MLVLVVQNVAKGGRPEFRRMMQAYSALIKDQLRMLVSHTDVIVTFP